MASIRSLTICIFDRGSAFKVSVRGHNAQRICHGDTVMNKSLPGLAYGDIWQRGGFTCTSDQAGLTSPTPTVTASRCRRRRSPSSDIRISQR